MVAAQAVAAAAMEIPFPEESAPAEEVSSLREKLDFKPTLSSAENVASWAIPAILCALLYAVTKPARISPLYGAGMAVLYAIWVAVARSLLLERHYAEAMMHESQLVDQDSRFASLHGVSVHYKAASPYSQPKATIHCFHGFGANTASWGRIHRQLAYSLAAQVTAHDMPGFGLTERPKEGSKYSLDFNGRLGREIMDLELERRASAPPAKPQDSASSVESLQAGKEQKSASDSGKTSNGVNTGATGSNLPRVLMGHSLGASCAAAEAIKNPKAVDALILVAPAIMAPGFLTPAGWGKSGEFEARGGSGKVSFSGSPTERPPVKMPLRARRNVVWRAAAAARKAVLVLLSMLVTRLLRPIMVLALRSAVRNRAFWERGLSRAWYDKAGVTPEVVDAYRQPQLVRGWEEGLMQFTAAQIAGGKGGWGAVADAWRGEAKLPQAVQLAETVAEHNIKVLIVHGEHDPLIPVSNSRRLAKLLPTASLVGMPRVGHVPHEERPSEFVAAVCPFLERA